MKNRDDDRYIPPPPPNLKTVLSCILTPDVPNRNGVIFPKAVCDAIMKQVNENPNGIPLVSEISGASVPLDNVVGRVTNMRVMPILEDSIIADVEVYNGVPKGPLFSGYITSLSSVGLKVELGGCFVANVDDKTNTVMDDCVITQFSLSCNDKAIPLKEETIGEQ